MYNFLGVTIVIARILIELIFFAIGASIFSFLNVVIYRMPRHIQFTKGKSMCTSCGHELMTKDLIPIISWMGLRGKCRYCGAPISVRYTIVEVLGGISAAICTLILGISLRSLAAFLITGILTIVICIIYDKLRHRD